MIEIGLVASVLGKNCLKNKRLHGWAEGGELHKIRLYDGDKIVKVTGRRGIGRLIYDLRLYQLKSISTKACPLCTS